MLGLCPKHTELHRCGGIMQSLLLNVVVLQD